jgi:hypothetical protein
MISESDALYSLFVTNYSLYVIFALFVNPTIRVYCLLKIKSELKEIAFIKNKYSE